MSIYYNPDKDDFYFGRLLSHIGIFVCSVVFLGMWGCPRYNVWQQGLAGEAELKRAEQNRRIAVNEAQAKRDSAKLFAAAEVERARGVAEANKIIADGLKGHEEYLRYLWIVEKAGTGVQREVIYVPTEANMPILEAQRLASKPVATEPQ